MVEADDIVNHSITEEKLGDGSVSTRTLQDGCVTEPKVADDAISTRTIQDGAVTEPKMGDGSVSNRTIQNDAVDGRCIAPGSIESKHLANDAVTTPKIKDGAVTPNKLSNNVQHAIVKPLTDQVDAKYKNITDELYSLIASLQVGGIALSQQFGDRTDIGISQKTLTKVLGRMWDELAIITGKTYMDFTLTVQPIEAYTEGPATITITADCSEAISDFDSIKIYNGNELIAESEDVVRFTTSLSIDQTSVIRAVGMIMGKTITKEQTVIKEIPFFIGSGQVYTDVMNPSCLQPLDGTLEGDYDVTIRNNGDYMFIIIPISRKDEFRRADMNGLGLKVEIPLNATEHEDYVVYQSVNTYKAGTYNIDIDINS